ncbi:hypothetical protein CesoFtcFv8_013258 [Champsocephalus esox]|uniref:Uncharacterized protein n=1 Tax=Champsocephalus esox TaxID=159716 RepID=A0AAN8GVW3_9TELE|nr:hypothetical protein CesoFtcFv8_013258 [Champsocephalus esox]
MTLLITFPYHCSGVLPALTSNTEPWSIWRSSAAFNMMDVTSHRRHHRGMLHDGCPPGQLLITIFHPLGLPSAPISAGLIKDAIRPLKVYNEKPSLALCRSSGPPPDHGG